MDKFKITHIKHKNGLGFKNLTPKWNVHSSDQVNEELTEVCDNSQEDANESSKTSET